MDVTRKQFLAASATALATALVPTIGLAQTIPEAKSDSKKLTLDDLRGAAKVAGIELTDAQLQGLLKDVQDTLDTFPALRRQTDDAFLAPATTFRVMGEPRGKAVSVKVHERHLRRPASDEDLAFMSAADLSHLIHTHQVSSVELTRLYLARLEKYGPKL
ncbi:MAG: hypothetical protein ABUL72_05905, partial [Armatimonadota bacterium]